MHYAYCASYLEVVSEHHLSVLQAASKKSLRELTYRCNLLCLLASEAQCEPQYQAQCCDAPLITVKAALHALPPSLRYIFFLLLQAAAYFTGQQPQKQDRWCGTKIGSCF